MDNMENNQLTEVSRDQLDRVLGFFSRVDTVSSFVLGIDIGMLALLAANAPPVKSLSWYALGALIPVVLMGKSLAHLYQASFPQLEGGWMSLIYFREIAARNEDEFIRDFSAQTEGEYIRGLLSQVWRNSEILTKKFDHLKSAFLWLAYAVVPWLICLFWFASQHSENLLGK